MWSKGWGHDPQPAAVIFRANTNIANAGRPSPAFRLRAAPTRGGRLGAEADQADRPSAAAGYARTPASHVRRAEVVPVVEAAHRKRLVRPGRQRAIGGGDNSDLSAADQLLLTVIWLRQYPTNEVLGFVFGVSDSTASRVRARCLPVLEGFAIRNSGLIRNSAG